MDLASTLKTLLKEANIYQSQGLLVDARKKYEAAAALLADSTEFKNKDELLAGVAKKITSLEKVVYQVEKRTVTPEISSTDKELIKKLFSVSSTHDPDDAAMEGAMALAKFGLFDRAIQEFELLLYKPERRMEVAKHILRCRMAIRMAHDPMVQYKKWTANPLFSKEELDKIKVFLEKAYGVMAPAAPAVTATPLTAPVVSTVRLQPQSPKAPAEKPPPVSTYDPYEDSYEDVLASLPKMVPPKTGASQVPPGAENVYDDFIDSVIPEKKAASTLKVLLPQEDSFDDYIDYISSVSFPISSGPRAGQFIEVPVNLQTAATVNLIVSEADKDLIAMLRKGGRIEKIKLNSPIAVSNGNGVVIAAALIDQGPLQGDYSVDLKIES